MSLWHCEWRVWYPVTFGIRVNLVADFLICFLVPIWSARTLIYEQLRSHTHLHPVHTLRCFLLLRSEARIESVFLFFEERNEPLVSPASTLLFRHFLLKNKWPRLEQVRQWQLRIKKENVDFLYLITQQGFLEFRQSQHLARSSGKIDFVLSRSRLCGPGSTVARKSCDVIRFASRNDRGTGSRFMVHGCV